MSSSARRLSTAIVAVLLQGGRFTATDSVRTWAILAGSAVGLVASCLGRLYSSTFYALRDTRTPFWFALARVVLTGVLGYLFMRLDCEPAPMILGFVLGPLMEDNLRRALRISSGDPMIFINRPISLGLLIAAAILLAIVAFPAIRNKREEAFQES